MSQTQATVWARASKRAHMHVMARAGKDAALYRHQLATDATDFTARVQFDGLKPGTQYSYLVWFDDKPATEKPPKGAPRREGAFKTAPRASDGRAVRFAWGGDTAGQNVCRHADRGFPIFRHVRRHPLDFVVTLGDMIYADEPCLPMGGYGNPQVPMATDQARTLAQFWEHWKYLRADRAFQRLSEDVGFYTVWDDHEVVNDFGPKRDYRSYPPYTGRRLMPIGRAAFEHYNPQITTQHRYYSNVRWGRHLELFFLDTRQYRDLAEQHDQTAKPKTMLGSAQRDWFIDAFTKSNATWKIVITSVPLSIPTGFPLEGARDGWANQAGPTGYERELQVIFEAMSRARPRDAIFLTADVHFAAGFRYEPLGQADDYTTHEFVAGPFSAGLFRNDEYDGTFNAKRLFLYAPELNNPPRSYEEALPWFNFGLVQINQQGLLTVSIRNGHGVEIYSHTLVPEHRKPVVTQPVP